METRKRYLLSVRSLVVKLGTQLLSDPQKRLDAAFLAEIARQVVALRAKDIHVTIVSSGAVGAGLRELDLPKRPGNLAELQAVAAVGQRKLMDAWASAFSPHKIPVAQLLLTREDIDSRTRFLNLRNTIEAVQALGAVPIINENDTVSTDEIIKITFGDNDILAALVTHAMCADLLVLLTVVDGLLDSAGKPVRLVQSIEEAQRLVRKEKSVLGKGGMDSKLQAADMITESGHSMIVADGRSKDILVRLLEGQVLGTLFMPRPKRRPSRISWISAARPVGAVIVDAGAAAAVGQKNKSLLPAGVVRVEGAFDRGDVIGIKSPEGRLIARGLSNYSSAHVQQIRGKKSTDIRSLLGQAAYEEIVHRNNLVLE